MQASLRVLEQDP